MSGLTNAIKKFNNIIALYALFQVLFLWGLDSRNLDHYMLADQNSSGINSLQNEVSALKIEIMNLKKLIILDKINSNKFIFSHKHFYQTGLPYYE